MLHPAHPEIFQKFILSVSEWSNKMIVLYEYLFHVQISLVEDEGSFHKFQIFTLAADFP